MDGGCSYIRAGSFVVICLINGKVLPRTGHEGPKLEYMYSSALSLTSELDGVGGQRKAPAALLPGRKPCRHCIGGCVSPRDGLGPVRKNQPPPGIRYPDHPVRNESLYLLSYLGSQRFVWYGYWYGIDNHGISTVNISFWCHLTHIAFKRTTV